MTTTLLLTYVAILVVLASLRTVVIDNPIVQRLRAFFPSWRFFDDLGDAPILWVRIDLGDTQQNDGFGQWQPCLATAKRNWFTWLWNPQGNLRLAYDSLLMHLLTDIQEGPARLSECVSYQLTQQLVAHQLESHPAAASIVRYQFKLSCVPPFTDLTHGQDVMLSPVIER